MSSKTFVLRRALADSRPAVAADDVSVPAVRMAVGPLPAAVCLIAIGLFLLYALNFLYFFVDDEGIPFVYAQNLLHGRGLRYDPLDAPVEGYSDFLHVITSTLWLTGVRALALDKLTVFALGKALSLVSAIGIIIFTFRAMRDLALRRSAALTGLLALATAGPLAVWACSSLETAFFSLLITALVVALLDPERRAVLGGLCAIAAVLERIDGVLFVAVLAATFLAIHTPAARRATWRAIVLPAALVVTAYHGWRVWYFGELLPMPVYAKVAFKLRPSAHLLTKATPFAYTLEFLRLYAGVPLLCLAAAFTPLARRDRRILALQSSLVLLALYVTVVGDWMFGFRFFVPLLPLMVVLLATVLSEFAAWSRVGQRVCVTLLVTGALVLAYRFEKFYEAREDHGSFLLHPSFDRRAFFGHYYDAMQKARTLVHPGDLIATNQAGLVPFALDVRNIDNLGLCSRFYAKLPTTDVYFTEVGRYSPLTNKPVFRAGDAYLLYREPAYIIESGDRLRADNGGHAPVEILGGAYHAIWTDRDNASVMYARTERPLDAFKQSPREFLENVAHVSSIREARVNDEVLARGDYQGRLGYFAEGAERAEVNGRYQVDVRFSDADVRVYELFAQSVYASEPAIVSLTLRSAEGRTVWQHVDSVPARTEHTIHERLPESIGASRVTLTIAGDHQQPLYVRIADVRVQGQSDRLTRYLTHALTFPPRGDR